MYNNAIPGLGEVVYTFNTKVDFSVSGTYKLTVLAELVGDEFPDNNELSVSVKNLVCNAITFPYDEGFEEEVFPPYCWTKIGEWKRIPYGAHTGIGRASYAWWDGSLGWLIMPKFSIPTGGDFMLEFWSYIYDKKYFSYSGVWVSTTNDNPLSFTEILSLSGDMIPDEVWKRIEIPLKQYAGKEIYLAFKYTNSGGQSGHMWSVDDINVFNLSNLIDAEVVDIVYPPALGMNLTNAEPVTVKIKNNGGATISGFKLVLEHNGTVIATENYTGYIASLASANYTFNAKLNLYAAVNHTVKVTVVLTDDMNPNNNSKTKIVENRVCLPVTNFPWNGDFTGNGSGGISDCWINIDADGDTKKWFSLKTNGEYYAISESYDTGSEYPLSPDNWLITPPLVLQNNCYLTYKIGGANKVENSAEKYSVLVSTKGIDIADFTEERTETLYPSDYTEQLAEELSGYGLKNAKVPLTSYSGKQIHIAFRHWDCTAQDRLVLSDINVLRDLTIKDDQDNEKLLSCWRENDQLFVRGLIIGESVELYTMMGSLLYQNVVDSELMCILLKTRGVYIIKSGERVLKVVY